MDKPVQDYPVDGCVNLNNFGDVEKQGICTQKTPVDIKWVIHSWGLDRVI